VSVNIKVGRLAELLEYFPDQNVEKEFEAIHRVLKRHGVKGYEEPTQLDAVWTESVTPENGIAFLQRFVSYFPMDDPEDEWPTPGNEEMDPFKDEMHEDAISLLELHPFQHLLLHRWEQGYWVPVDFPDVIFPSKRTGITMIGSSVRLLQECDELAKILRLPGKITLDDSDLCDALNNPGKGKTRWKKYGIESYNLVLLRTACQKSIATGAAVVLE
jgi:hypothetical protein